MGSGRNGAGGGNRLTKGNARLVGSLLAAAAGLTLSRVAEPDGSAIAPGVVILAVAAVLVACVRRWWSELAALVAVSAVLVSRLGDGLLGGLVGERGGGVAVGNFVLLVGCVVAAVVSAAAVASRVRLRRAAGAQAPPGGPAAPSSRPHRGHLGLALTLMVLSAICAEELAAYDDTTGRPAELVAGVVLFGALYGGPALFLRELARRTGRGGFRSCCSRRRPGSSRRASSTSRCSTTTTGRSRAGTSCGGGPRCRRSD